MLKGELQRRWCLEFFIVCRLCQAAYTLLEAAPTLTIGQRRSTRRFTVNLQSHIKRVTRGCESQSNDVWPREETSSLFADAEQDEEHKAKEGHTRIRRRRSDKRAVRVCAHNNKRDRTIDTGREGTPEEVQEQTAPDCKYEIVHSSKTSGDSANRRVPTSVVSTVSGNCVSTAAESTIRLDVTRAEDGAG